MKESEARNLCSAVHNTRAGACVPVVPHSRTQTATLTGTDTHIQRRPCGNHMPTS